MIDITKCYGCNKGIDSFVKNDEGLWEHWELFGNPESGQIFSCQNSEEVEPHLVENEVKGGIFLAKGELRDFYAEQSFWWEDILELIVKIFPYKSERVEFASRPDSLFKRPNVELEKDLLEKADMAGLVITEEEYPDLLIWQKEKENE